MLATLAFTSFVMGLAGGPHCLAMCSAPCGALVGSCTPSPGPGRVAGEGTQVLRQMPRGSRAQRMGAFQMGRMASYALAGALAAWTMGSLAWLTQQTQALAPVWTMVHVAVLAWGGMMVFQARQPVGLERVGRWVWRCVQPWVQAPGGVGFAGFLWTLMPCGLLYSALLVAALSGGPWQGAMSMALFALGSGLWLVGGPWLWGRLRQQLNAFRVEWGTRLAGGLLCGVAGWALWMDLVYKPSLWCR
ncbi:MAG: sulfite exporter TauE/SafE family protein [Burkholderiaceae bacterium]|nr:sulfite exporter TauE/SafE family protein [Burkholderiaceae bacterium]